MEMYNLIQICKAYDKLGWAVQSQVDDVLDGSVDDCNGNALEMIRDTFLRAVKRYGDAELSDEVDAFAAEIAASIGAH